jgi:integrase
MPRRVENVEHHRPLTEEEFLTAFHAAEEPLKTLSLIGWHTGARLETCKRIMVELLSHPANDITIKPGKTARFGRSVFIPIHAELRAWIDHIIESGADWKSWEMKQVSGKKRLSPYVQLLRSLNIMDTEDGKASFHSLRYSFITRCDEKKIDRHATQGVVGQVSDETTNLYSHDKESAKAILTLPSLGLFSEKESASGM